MLRLVGRDGVEPAMPWVTEWAPIVAGWIAEGLTPYVYAHAPNDLYAPQLARAFHDELRKHIGSLDPMPEWPGEVEQRTAVKQLELF